MESTAAYCNIWNRLFATEYVKSIVKGLSKEIERSVVTSINWFPCDAIELFRIRFLGWLQSSVVPFSHKSGYGSHAHKMQYQCEKRSEFGYLQLRMAATIFLIATNRRNKAESTACSPVLSRMRELYAWHRRMRHEDHVWQRIWSECRPSIINNVGLVLATNTGPDQFWQKRFVRAQDQFWQARTKFGDHNWSDRTSCAGWNWSGWTSFGPGRILSDSPTCAYYDLTMIVATKRHLGDVRL